MNWLNILKKNDKEFEKTINKKNDNIIVIDENIDENIEDAEIEFEKEYSIIIRDLEFDFKEYINELVLPFLNGVRENRFYDFIKNNCKNFKTVIDRVDLNNKEYINELEEENDDIIYDKKFSNFNCV